MSTIPFWSAVPSSTSDRLSSLPFHWCADDRSLDALSGQTGTFTRATAGGAWVDALGLVGITAHSQPRWEVVDDAVTGGKRLGLLIEKSRQNLITYSEDLSNAAWSDGGTPTLTSAALVVGRLSLDLLGDDAGGALEWKEHSIGFTANAAKYISLFVAKGTSTSTVIRLRDSTASANRLLAAITWSGTTPVVTMTTGTAIGQRELGSDVWELRFQTTSVTAANSNTLAIFPATDVALATSNTGTIYVGGVGAFNSLGGVGYSANTSSALTLNAETLTWPYLAPRTRSALYLAYTELGARYTNDGGSGFCVVGDIANCGMGFYSGSSQYAAFHYANGSGDLSFISSAAGYPAMNVLVELCLTMSATGVPSIEVAFDGVSQGTVAGSTAPANMTEDWTNNIIRLGAFGSDSSFNHSGAVYHALKVAEIGTAGSPTLAKMRGYR